jgi:hypothetical protein
VIRFLNRTTISTTTTTINDAASPNLEPQNREAEALLHPETVIYVKELLLDHGLRSTYFILSMLFLDVADGRRGHDQPGGGPVDDDIFYSFVVEVHSRLRSQPPFHVVRLNAAIYTASVITYLTREVLELAITSSRERAVDGARNVLEARDVYLAMRGDQELSELTRSVLINTPRRPQ